MNEQQVGKASRIAALIVGNMQDKLSTDERQELNTWLQEDGENFLLYEELMDEDKLGASLDELYTIDPDMAYERLSQKLFITEEVPAVAAVPAPKRLSPKLWWYMAAAMLLLVGGGITYVALNKNSQPAPAPAIQVLAQHKQPGAQPDSKKATLTLADGSVVVLNDMNNGSIAKQGNTEVIKNQNGIVQYTTTQQTTGKDTYNMLTTPAGGQYRVILEDGTSIWLNAASTLRYPVHFTTDDRRVYLTGEAYFEVASQKSPTTGRKKTFVVSAGNMEMEAIGTAFNVSAYKEDNSTQTTVLEGLVKVNAYHTSHFLEPGKKLVARDSTLQVEDADTKLETAWKNDEFVFHNTSLPMVMNELARWYNVTIEYKQPVPSLHFSGEIERQVSIDRVLQMLSYTGGVKFAVHDNKVTVLASK